MSGVWVWIAAGALGAVGSVARFLIDGEIGRRARSDLPWGTLTVNLVGALALGLCVGAGVDGDARFLAVGGLTGPVPPFSPWLLVTLPPAGGGGGRQGEAAWGTARPARTASRLAAVPRGTMW